MPRRLPFVLAIALLPGMADACGPSTALEGMLAIEHCDPQTAGNDCISGGRAIYEALEALDMPGVYTIGVQTSPWRMYDAEGRIMTVDEAAASIRAKRPESDKRVHLAGSWTAARPDGSDATLAKRLSDALDGLPVDGSDGFLWLGPTGAMRTTRQAFSVRKAGSYSVTRGDDVLMPLVPGAMAEFLGKFVEDDIPEGVVQAGIGHDVFLLCPEGALAAFERAADMGSAIGAYNAGLMHAENGQRDAAITRLEQAETLGEAKAAAALANLRKEP